MGKKERPWSKIKDIFDYMVDVDSTSYREIKKKFSICNDETVRRYYDWVEERYNVTIKTSRGNGGGSRICKTESATTHLTIDEEQEIMNLLMNCDIDENAKKIFYGMLIRMGNPNTVKNFSKEYKGVEIEIIEG